MNTQNTPIHIRLWHADFWRLVVADLLLTMAVYILIPAMPRWLIQTENFSPVEAGLCMGAFGLGLYLLGSQCSWLVQRYRRNQVCMWAIVAMVADVMTLVYFDHQRTEFAEFWMILVQRLLLGATFGLAQMVLSSTLIIDTCESYMRTEANHNAAWFARFALSLGPLAGILVLSAFGYTSVWWAAAFNLLLVSIVMGMLLTLPLTPVFYGLMMVGFLLALLAQRFVFRDAELKSEVISGQILLIAALLTLLGYPESPVAPVLVGLGMGIISARFLLFFIKLSRHCKRGTSQSTFFLGWETGLALGLCAGYALWYEQRDTLLYICIGFIAASLLMYHFYTHSWFMRNKNR